MDLFELCRAEFRRQEPVAKHAPNRTDSAVLRTLKRSRTRTTSIGRKGECPERAKYVSELQARRRAA